MRRFYYESDGSRVEFYIGSPSLNTRDVLFFQSKHLMSKKNMDYNPELKQNLNDLFIFSKKYKIRLDQLCAYLLVEDLQ